MPIFSRRDLPEKNSFVFVLSTHVWGRRPNVLRYSLSEAQMVKENDREQDLTSKKVAKIAKERPRPRARKEATYSTEH